jgi:hypothetical protein
MASRERQVRRRCLGLSMASDACLHHYPANPLVSKDIPILAQGPPQAFHRAKQALSDPLIKDEAGASPRGGARRTPAGPAQILALGPFLPKKRQEGPVRGVQCSVP